MSSNLSHLHSKFKAGSQIDYGHFLTLFYHFVKLHITFLHIDTNFILCKAGIMQHREKSLSPKQRWNTSLPDLSLVTSLFSPSFSWTEDEHTLRSLAMHCDFGLMGDQERQPLLSLSNLVLAAADTSFCALLLFFSPHAVSHEEG